MSHIRPSGVFDTSYKQDMALNRTRADKLIKYGGFLLLLILPFLTEGGAFGIGGGFIKGYVIATLNSIAIFVIAVQGLNILVGYTGQMSLGHAAFMAVGAYSAAALAKQAGLPFWVGLPLAGLITAFVGLLFGLPSLRVKGFYLAMATLAAQFIIPWILENPLHDLTNAPYPLQGIPAPNIGPLIFNTENEFFFIAIPMSVFMMLAARNIIRTRTGRAFISVRDNDLAAELLGINTFVYKLQAFFISSFFAGIAGALLAYNKNAISIESFRFDTSIELLAMLIIGGAGYSLGPLFGVTFVKFLSNFVIPTLGPIFNVFLASTLPFIDSLNISPSLQPIIFGGALLIFLLLEPRGLAYRWEILKISWKIRPYSY
ncbi:branched-chain amino acid ABC transporter permease [Anaerolineales bacterium]